jgi:rhamnulokinase
MVNSHVLAVDLGASNGRVMKCTYENSFQLDLLHRFPNAPIQSGGHLRWDTKILWNETLKGIKMASEDAKSIGVDSWGVDFALLDRDGHLIEDPVHYRDPRTKGMMQWVFQRISRREIFDRTGTQFLELNTLYQLASLVKNRKGLLGQAKTYLGFPDLFNHWLTMTTSAEFTHATTTQCLNAIKRSWDTEILDAVGVPTEIFPDPGETIGTLRGITVSVPACHDTGSAVVAVPSTYNNICYLSSGTWSLMGTETEAPIINDDVYKLNFTNEGGVQKTNRLLRNLPGLWLEQQLIKEWNGKGLQVEFDDLKSLASMAEPFRSLIDLADPRFLSPGDMTPRILAYCREHGEPEPRNLSDHIRCVYDSLALSYRHCLEQIETITCKHYHTINVIGGGSRNTFLNQHIAEITQRKVVAGPEEATALGNSIVQLICIGSLRDVHEARNLLMETLDLRKYYAVGGLEWEEAYDRFRSMSS